jgi:hypothetical protein
MEYVRRYPHGVVTGAVDDNDDAGRYSDGD